MPRPGTPVIHPGMLPTVQAIAVDAQHGTCKLLTPGAGQAMDPTTLAIAAGAPTVLWTGPCRVQPKSRALATIVDAGERPVTLTDFQVTIPMTAPDVPIGTLVHLLTSADPLLVDKELRVMSVAYGEYQGERHLTCQDNETPWPA